MNKPTQQLLDTTSLMLFFVKAHPDCDIDELAKNHLKACADTGLKFTECNVCKFLIAAIDLTESQEHDILFKPKKTYTTTGIVISRKRGQFKTDIEPCPDCGGSGRIVFATKCGKCPTCKGTGVKP